MKDFPVQGSGLVALSKWTHEVGIAPITAWRFRKRGWLTTINIAGRQYISTEAIAEFTRKAAVGEFAQQHHVPRRTQCS